MEGEIRPRHKCLIHTGGTLWFGKKKHLQLQAIVIGLDIIESHRK